MTREQKTFILWYITEDYLKRHGIQTIDWDLSYFAQPLNIVSCIDDIACIAGIRSNSLGWSRAQVLYQRIQLIQPF